MYEENKYLQRVQALGGYYDCRKFDGKRCDPLVGYTARDEQNRQFVGETYINFAVVEEYPDDVNNIARDLMPLHVSDHCDGYCGAPEGGKALAFALAAHARKRYIYPGAKVLVAATETSREISEMVFGRHKPGPGERWWIVEDVCNNFSTTSALVKLIESYGAEVVGIICFLNRSLKVDTVYTTDSGQELPVVALVFKPIPEYRQDDPEVAEDIKNGNVVWKPKDDWAKLEASKQRPMCVLVPKNCAETRTEIH